MVRADYPAGTIRQVIPNLHIDHEKLIAFCQKWHVVELSVFGSVLRHDFHEGSDIDFLVTFSDDWVPTLFDLVHMNDEMAAIAGRPVDVIDKAGIEQSRNPYRRDHILSNYEVVYAA